MSTYRERREARAERLREWADKRDDKAAGARAGADRIADGIPMGQPILVGHHSERRARRDQDRIYSGMKKSIEHSDKAAEMRRKADNIERAAEHAIYSDDDDAVERLTERIAGLEAERERVKAFNKAVRKGGTEAIGEALELLSESQRRGYLQTVKNGGALLGKGGTMPAYVLTNLGGNIRRQKKRLEGLS